MELNPYLVLVVVACLTLLFIIVASPRNGKSNWGRCKRCNRTWQHLKSHTTTYSETSNCKSGCFPLCESCWQKLGTPEARLPFYRLLWEDWVTQCPEAYEDDTVWVQIERAVKNGG